MRSKSERDDRRKQAADVLRDVRQCGRSDEYFGSSRNRSGYGFGRARDNGGYDEDYADKRAKLSSNFKYRRGYDERYDDEDGEIRGSGSRGDGSRGGGNRGGGSRGGGSRGGESRGGGRYEHEHEDDDVDPRHHQGPPQYVGGRRDGDDNKSLCDNMSQRSAELLRGSPN